MVLYCTYSVNDIDTCFHEYSYVSNNVGEFTYLIKFDLYWQNNICAFFNTHKQGSQEGSLVNTVAER